MNQEAFLEKLYFGNPVGDYFSSFRVPSRLPKTEAVIDGYLALVSRYSPLNLEEKGGVPEDLLWGLKELGLFGLIIPEQYGGLGLDITQYLLITEQIARIDMGLAIIPLAHLSIGVKGVLLHGTDDQKRKYLPPAASGDTIFAFALTEPKIGSDAQHIETTAVRSEDGSHYILNGTKTYVTNGGIAGALTLFAGLAPEHPGYMGAFIVETGWEGVEVGKPMPKMGLHTSSTTMIRFRNVRVPAENMLGSPGDGFKIAMSVLNYGRLGLGAASVGSMQQAVEDMTDRAEKRIQFGVPIQRFELVQEMIAKAKVNGFIARAMTYFTSGLLDKDPFAMAAIESSHTKLFGTTHGWATLYDALQVAGGAGYLKSLPYEKRLRDFRVTTVFEGTTEIHSIYPALYLARRIVKTKKSKPAIFFAFAASLIGFPHVTLPADDSRIKEALSLAMSCTRQARRMLYRGLIKYGKKLIEQEFFLRRVTRLSMSAFGLISGSCYICALAKAGHNVDAQIRLLKCFMEETRLIKRWNRKVANTRWEQRLKKALDTSIKSGSERLSDPAK